MKKVSHISDYRSSQKSGEMEAARREIAGEIILRVEKFIKDFESLSAIERANERRALHQQIAVLPKEHRAEARKLLVGAKADTAKDFDAAMKEFKPDAPADPEDERPVVVPFESAFTDAGNGRLLADLHRGFIKFCHPWKKWFLFDGQRWSPDQDGRIFSIAKKACREFYQRAADEEDEARRRLYVTWGKNSESAFRLKAMTFCAESEPGIPVQPEDFDADPWAFNAANGTVDLRTGELRPHDPGDLISKVSPAAYDPDAECPNWNLHLNLIFQGNEDVIDFFQKAAGYSLTGLTSERKFFVCHGDGRNGKSATIDVLAEICGDYATRTQAETFLLNRRENSIPNDVAALRGSRFVFASESEDERRLAEAKIKELTGGDTITARFLHGEFFQFKPGFKLWFITNYKPVIKGTDSAIWDRILMFPFDFRIPEDSVIPSHQLMSEFRKEFPGILAWLVRGCLRWQEEGLISPPAEIRAANENYRKESDSLSDFLDECCVENPTATVTLSDLFIYYLEWCSKNKESSLKKKDFTKELEKRGFRKDKNNKGWYWKGLGILTTVNCE